MAETTTTALYVVVLAGWFLLMCIVLRCCSAENEAQSIFDFDQEINISAIFSELHPKPTVLVDGEPMRFARVQPLGSSSSPSRPAHAAATDPASSQDMVHIPGGVLNCLEVPNADSTLPSAEAVWSPILALRTFVEPLTTRASAAFRNFHVSFHEQEEPAPRVRRGGENLAAVSGGWSAGPGEGEGEGEDAGAGAMEGGGVEGAAAEGVEGGGLRREESTSAVAASGEVRMASRCGEEAEIEIAEFGHDRGHGEIKVEMESEVDAGQVV